VGWFEALPESQKQTVHNHLGWSAKDSHGIGAALVRSMSPSPAGLTIVHSKTHWTWKRNANEGTRPHTKQLATTD
jgi:hypothetical protein